RPLPRPARQRPRLPPGQDRERPERGHQGADGDRLGAASTDLHRRALRPELQAHPGARLELRLLVELGPDRANHGCAARLLPVARLDRRRAARPAEAAAAETPGPAYACRATAPRLTWLPSPRAILHLPELQGAVDRP